MDRQIAKYADTQIHTLQHPRGVAPGPRGG